MNIKDIINEEIENLNNVYLDVEKDIKNSAFGQEIYKINLFNSANNDKIGLMIIRIFINRNKAEVFRVEIADKYKGQGYAKFLYNKGKELANKFGANLYGGEIQSDDARKVWDSLRKKGISQSDSNGEDYI